MQHAILDLQLLFERIDLLICECVGNGDGHHVGDVLQQPQFFLRKCPRLEGNEINHAEQFTVLRQWQGYVAPYAVLQEVVVSAEFPLMLHVRVYVRFARPHDRAQIVIVDWYSGAEWFEVEVGCFPLEHALHGFMTFALKTLNIQRVQFGVVAIAYNNADCIELNQRLQSCMQCCEDVRQFQMSADGFRHFKNHWSVQSITLRERQLRDHKYLGPYLPSDEYTYSVARDGARHQKGQATTIPLRCL